MALHESAQRWQSSRLSRDLNLCILPKATCGSISQAIDGEEYLGRHSIASFFPPGVLDCESPVRGFASSPSMRKITFFPLHARKCSTTAETTYAPGPFSSTLISAIMPMAMSSIPKNENNSLPGASCAKQQSAMMIGNSGSLYGLSVMGIVCGSGSHAIAAASSGNLCVGARAWPSPNAFGPMGTLLPLAFLSS